MPCLSQFYYILADSPIFGPYIIDDDYLNDNVDIEKYEKNNTSIFDDLPVDILSTTYYSNGKTLNGSIWLSDPIYDKRHDDYLHGNLTYTMNIWREDEHGPIVDYIVTIYPELDGTWTKKVQTFEPDVSYLGITIPETASRILESIDNYSNFYENEQRYIDISIDLETIGLSDEYFVRFYVDAVNKNGTVLHDEVGGEHAPPKKALTVFDWPDELQVRAGEDEIAAIIRINTTDLYDTEKVNLTDANITDDIILEFEPQTVNLPLNGITNTKMTIKAEKDAYKDKGNPILLNQTVNGSGMNELGDPVNYAETFALEILPPFSRAEQIGNILRNNPLTYLIPLGITSAFAIWLSNRLPKMTYDPELIRVKDILTVDASVIAGVLIFLTVGASEVFSGRVIQQVGILTASIVFPFAIGAIRTLIKGKVEHYGVKFMISGFIYLMASVILIAFIQK